MSSDKRLQKKSTGYSAEVLIPYTLKLRFCLIWDYCSLAPWHLTSKLFPLLPPPSWLIATRKQMLPWKFCIFIRVSSFSCEILSIYWGNAKEHFRRIGSTQSCFSALSWPIKFLPHRIVKPQLCRYLAVARLNPPQEGKLSWTVALSWARKIKPCKLLTPASSNIKVIQLSAKLFFTRNHAARKTNTQADNRSWVSTVRDSYSRQLQNHTQLELENSVFNSMQNTKTQEFTWSNTLFWSLRQTGHPNLKSNHRAAMERESN